jgi:alkanesulfonate monooxygenase SsuD/methylene tetrahydromethanopterin reductase-like flavin-dependent oxidoreductase (luciferase family)
MQTRPFRFGITSYGAESGAEWVRKSRRAEELGYASLFVSDHFMGQISTIPALAYAVASTTRLRVGSIVCSNDFRHPALLAKEGAAIDMLSGGRFELGLDRISAPVQKPHPPLLIGGGGKRMLTLAGREADIVSLTKRLKIGAVQNPQKSL